VVFNIKNDDNVNASHREENPASVAKSKVFQNAAKHGFTEEQLDQNLKNYIDCNLDGMVYNENMKK